MWPCGPQALGQSSASAQCMHMQALLLAAEQIVIVCQGFTLTGGSAAPEASVAASDLGGSRVGAALAASNSGGGSINQALPSMLEQSVLQANNGREPTAFSHFDGRRLAQVGDFDICDPTPLATLTSVMPPPWCRLATSTSVIPPPCRRLATLTSVIPRPSTKPTSHWI